MTDTNILLSLLGVFATVAGIFFWRMFTRMENKIDDWAKGCSDCKKELATKKELDEWKPGRETLKKEVWERVNHHRHDNKGNVVIT